MAQKWEALIYVHIIRNHCQALQIKKHMSITLLASIAGSLNSGFSIMTCLGIIEGIMKNHDLTLP